MFHLVIGPCGTFAVAPTSAVAACSGDLVIGVGEPMMRSVHPLAKPWGADKNRSKVDTQNAMQWTSARGR